MVPDRAGGDRRGGGGRRRSGSESAFAVALAVPAASGLAAARGLDLGSAATPVGPGCRACHHAECPQRSAPPAGRALLVSERERGVSGWTFVGD